MHFGRHEHKLKLVKGTQRVLVDAEHKAFDQHEQVRHTSKHLRGSAEMQGCHTPVCSRTRLAMLTALRCACRGFM